MTARKYHAQDDKSHYNDKLSSIILNGTMLLLYWVTLSATIEAVCGLYYKPMMIVNDDARIINKLDASLTDDIRVIIYDCHMLIVQAPGC